MPKAKTELQQYLDPKGWKETRRQFIGLQATGPCSGAGWSNRGYYQAIWAVSMIKKIGRTIYTKEEIEHGPAVRWYGDGYSAFCELYKYHADIAMNPGILAGGRDLSAMNPDYLHTVIMQSLDEKKLAENSRSGPMSVEKKKVEQPEKVATSTHVMRPITTTASKATMWQEQPTTKSVAGTQGCFGIVADRNLEHPPGFM
jgi:hypothetical protein